MLMLLVVRAAGPAACSQAPGKTLSFVQVMAWWDRRPRAARRVPPLPALATSQATVAPTPATEQTSHPPATAPVTGRGLPANNSMSVKRVARPAPTPFSRVSLCASFRPY